VAILKKLVGNTFFIFSHKIETGRAETEAVPFVFPAPRPWVAIRCRLSGSESKNLIGENLTSTQHSYNAGIGSVPKQLEPVVWKLRAWMLKLLRMVCEAANIIICHSY